MVSHRTPEVHLLIPTNLVTVTGRPQNFISSVDLLSSFYLNKILRGMTVKVNFPFNVISRLALETSHTKSIVIRAMPNGTNLHIYFCTLSIDSRLWYK